MRSTAKRRYLNGKLYVAAIALAFVEQWVSDGLYVVAALMWLVPDRRIESKATA